jgi:O-acetyl-ADP-ribose deacetylase (regulator of RNase III)
MPFIVVVGDLTQMKTDAIVNAANSSLTMGGGVCGAIFQAAGVKELTQACQAIGQCPTGQAVITPGFNLAAKYIIHTVGPVWSGGQNNESDLLANCYQNSLKLAFLNNCQSIAFPLISAGIFGYPKDQAKTIAEKTINSFLSALNADFKAYLVLRG